MVAAKLDQSRVLVTKFRQNRLTLKGRSAGQRHTDRHTDRQTDSQTNSAENNGPSGLQSGQKDRQTERHPFNGLFSGITCISQHQKAKPIWILMKQEMTKCQWHQLDHMQIICTSLQTDNHASTSSLIFYRPVALPGAQPTVSKH